VTLFALNFGGKIETVSNTE